MTWDMILSALVALCGAIAAILGSHKKLSNDIGTHENNVKDLLDKVTLLIEEIQELKRKD